MTPAPRSARRSRTGAPRRPLSWPVVAAAALTTVLAVAALAVPAEATKPGTGDAKPRGPAAPARTVDVMTRNLYLGASLTPIVTALAGGDPGRIVAAATRTWGEVQASEPEARMAAVADEIVAAKPAAVGLQEVTEWSTYAYDPATGEASDPTVVYDFLGLLMKALEERGADYRVVEGATAENFTSDPIPVLSGRPFPTEAIGLLDRDVVIVRDNVKAANAENGSFRTILGPPAFPLAIDRGWGSADLRTKRASFRFVNSHTEAFGPEEVRVGEVTELFAAQAAVAAEHGVLPTVYVGDYNSDAPDGATPGEAAYRLLASRLTDSWVAANGPAGGDTCCQDDLLTNPTSRLASRIDLVMTTPGITTTRAEVVGDEPVDLPGDVWWASDHAGVVARVVTP